MLKSVLDKFYSVLGINVSYGKSELFYCGVGFALKLQLASIVGG